MSVTSFLLKYQVAVVISAVVFILLSIAAWNAYINGSIASGAMTTASGAVVQYRFPPWISACPDYWSENSDGTCTQTHYAPLNTTNGYKKCDSSSIKANISINSEKGPANISFQDLSWVDKCSWAKLCNVQWEGVSDKACVSSSFVNYTS